MQSSAAVGATFTDPSIKVKYLDPVTMLPSAIGIDAKAPKQEQKEAEEFVEFVLVPGRTEGHADRVTRLVTRFTTRCSPA